MPTPIIALVGQAGSGKSTIASSFVDIYGAKVVSLASPLKRFLAMLMGFSNEALYGSDVVKRAPIELTDSVVMAARAQFDSLNTQAWLEAIDMTEFRPQLEDWFHQEIVDTKITSIRRLAQTLGTEWGRHNRSSVWVDYAVESCFTWLETTPLVVVDDVRFRNEILGLSKIGAKTVQIINPDAPISSDTHASEAEQTGIPTFWYDHRLVNSKDGIELLPFITKALFGDLFYDK